jgi:uncharacterized protein (TIGR02147 family)
MVLKDAARSEKCPNIFSYYHYRDFLNDWIIWKKAVEPGYSQRTFLKIAGIKGSAYLARVLGGSRKLSKKYIACFVGALQLKQDEARYFSTLVDFSNKKNEGHNALLLRELVSLRSGKTPLALDDVKIRYFSKWYYPVIRDLVDLVDFKEDYSLLAGMVIPVIKPSQARSAIRFLAGSGFIRKNENGRYTTTEPTVFTPPVVHSVVLKEYHRKNMELNLNAFETLKPQDRPFSSVTLSLRKDGFERVREEIRLFRQKLIALQSEYSDPDLICHVGFQLLPRAKVRKKEAV